MDENINDAFDKADKEYEPIRESVESRINQIDHADVAAHAFFMMLSNETQVWRAMDGFCQSLEYWIRHYWITNNIHAEFFEGSITDLHTDKDGVYVSLNSKQLWEMIVDGIDMYKDRIDTDED